MDNVGPLPIWLLMAALAYVAIMAARLSGRHGKKKVRKRNASASGKMQNRPFRR